MATATAQSRRDVKEYTFLWEGVDRNNRQVRGESRAASETVVTTNLRRQGMRDRQDQAADVPRRQAGSTRRTSRSSRASWRRC